MGPPGGAIKVGRHAVSQDISHSQPRLEGVRGILVSSLDKSIGVSFSSPGSYFQLALVGSCC